MPPVNSAPSTEVDNDATAELPVLDVAAYESTLNESTLNEEAAHTDTWAMPLAAEATQEMPAVKLAESTSGAPAYDSDHSGTHEMPALMPVSKRKAKQPKAARKAAAPAPVAPAHSEIVASSPEAILTTPVAPPPPPSLPLSPPLIEELRAALAAAERRIEELNERARIADAERQVAVSRANAECSELRQQLAAQLEAIATSRGRLGVQRTDETELQDAFDARGDRIAALERELAAQARVLQDTRAQLLASQKRCETLECDAMNLRATVARRDAQIGMIEADLQARQRREAELRARLDDALASVTPDVPELRAEIAAGDRKLQEFKSELNELRAALKDKEADLEVAEENIRQLENELSDKTNKLSEASHTVEEWRAVIAESQRSIQLRDTRIQKLESDLLQHRFSTTLDTAAQTGEEPALEGPARVLIRTDGNTDFVHVLGRRTRIGRGADNEIVLDTKHVSRFHAVLLAGPVNTSIEDLNSTNGVYVNGKRVSRQVLNNGDKVTIGKSQFRYTVRD